jgi:hypothetical protein
VQAKTKDETDGCAKGRNLCKGEVNKYDSALHDMQA